MNFFPVMAVRSVTYDDINNDATTTDSMSPTAWATAVGPNVYKAR